MKVYLVFTMMRKKNEAVHIMQTKATGESMTPIIRSGASIVLDISPKQMYDRGDIAAYLGFQGSIVVHRILHIQESPARKRQLILKGDNAFLQDRNIAAEQLFGKVIKIVYPTHSIDLTTIFSSFAARFIAYCGRITLSHPGFYTVERFMIIIMVGIMSSYARWTFLYKEWDKSR